MNDACQLTGSHVFYTAGKRHCFTYPLYTSVYDKVNKIVHFFAQYNYELFQHQLSLISR